MSAKNVLVSALLAKLETSYNAGASFNNATDGLLAVEPQPVFTIDYAYDGKRSTPAGNVGTTLRNAARGRSTGGKVTVEARGAGQAYSPSVLPPMHALLRASGMSATVNNGVVTYSPDSATTATPASVALRLFRRGEQYDVTGALATFTLGSTSADAPAFEFDIKGLINLPVDAACPDIAYPDEAIIPPTNTGINLQIGNYANPIVKTWKFDLVRAIDPALNISNVNGHAGFNPNRRAPKLTVTIESSLLGTFNPYTAQNNGTILPVTFTVGSVAGNMYTVSLPHAQITDCKMKDEGPVACWDLTFDAGTSATATNDDVLISFS